VSSREAAAENSGAIWEGAETGGSVGVCAVFGCVG
jgi:hypothetical protein